MTEEQWLENTTRLLARAEKFSADDIDSREFSNELRELLSQLKNKDSNYEVYRQGFGPGAQPASGQARHEAERTDLKKQIGEVELSLSRHIQYLESISLAEKLSTQSLALSKKMLWVSILSTLTAGLAIGAAATAGWQLQTFATLALKQPLPAAAEGHEPPLPIAPKPIAVEKTPLTPAPPAPPLQPAVQDESNDEEADETPPSDSAETNTVNQESKQQ